MDDKRQYGIDALKMLAMFLVVVNHILFWGGFGLDSPELGYKALGLKIIDAIALCAVNVFVMASGWIMSDREPKFRRIIELWLTVVCYSLIIAIIAKWLIRYPVGLRIWLHSVMPVGCNQYWFFTMYVGLFLAMPFLNRFISVSSERECALFSSVGFVSLSLYPWLQRHDLFVVNEGYSLIWFIYLYCVSGMAKRYSWHVKLPKWIGAALLLTGIAGNAIFPWLHCKVSGILGLKALPAIFISYTSPLLVAEGVGLMLIFARMDVKRAWIRTVLRWMAPSIFSVYIIHSNKVFRSISHWNEFWRDFLHGNSFMVDVAVVIGAASLIFAISVLLDQIRTQLFKRLYGK